MQVLLILLTAIVGGAGIYLLLRVLFKATPLEAKRAYKTAKGKEEKSDDKTVDSISSVLSRMIRFSPEKREEICMKIERAGMDTTPEKYYGNGILIILLSVAVGALVFFAINKLIGLFVILLGGLVGIKKITELNTVIKENNNILEDEVPRLVSTLNYTLGDNTDLAAFFEKYRKVCRPELRKELNWVLFRMQSGNAEQALRDWDARLNIPAYSQLISTLICVQSGAYQANSLLRVEMDVRAMQREKIKRKLEERPKKVKIYYISLLVAFMIVILGMLGIALVQSMSQFGL